MLLYLYQRMKYPIQTEEKVIHDTLNCAPDRGPVYEEDMFKTQMSILQAFFK